MLWFLGLFDPGWRDLSVSTSNTEITLIWILAGLAGAALYHFFLGKKGGISAEWKTKFEQLSREIQDEKNKHHKLKQQLEAAQSKANSFSASANELDKVKHKLHDLHKELEHAQAAAVKHKKEFDDEHAKVTSMMVDHSEVESLRNRVKNQEKELHAGREDSSKLKIALDAALSEKVRLAASLDESQITELRNKVQRLENDLHSSRLMVVKYQTEASRFEEDKKRLMEERQEVDGQSGETLGLRKRITELEADLQKARQGLGEAASLRSELEAVKSERDKWNQEADVQARNAAAAFELESKLSSLESKVKQAETEKLTLQGNLDSAKLESATLREALAKASGPIRPDNLKAIEGIGPKLEEMLNAKRIYTFGQLAETAVPVLQGILDEAGDAYQIHDPSTWPEQAQLLSDGKLDAFEKLIGELKGGRRVE